MSKRFWSVAISMALVAGVFGALPAHAETPIPTVVQIDDPANDANTTSGDQVTAAGNASNVGDLRKIWFSNTAETVSVHIQTTLPPPASAGGLLYTVLASPGEGSVSTQAAGCLQFRLFVPGANQGGTYQGEQMAKLHDRCNEGTNWIDNGIKGEVLIETLADETGLTTLSFPRSYSALLEDGKLLAKPTGRSDALVGTDKTTLPATPVTGKAYPWAGYRYDDTKVGTDYTISAGGPVSEPEPEPTVAPPGKNDPPGKGKKKGCDNGNGKKKGACPGGKPGKPKPPVAPACPPYVPGEEGKDAETTVVTDAATAEKPIVLELDSEMGLGNDAGLGEFATGNSVYDETTSFFHNIQLDTAAAGAGLYVKLEFPEVRDYDLYVNRADGTEADHSGDFNTAANTAFSCGGTSCESSMTSEAVLGLRTADCAGWTAKMVSFLSEGGSVTLSLWVGDVLAEPAPPPEPESETAMDMFFATLGL